MKDKNLSEKFNALWEQCIEMRKESIKYWLKENNKEMVSLNRDILKRMEEQYAKVKIKT